MRSLRPAFISITHYDIVERISIKLDGVARNASISIRINNRLVVDIDDCDSHSEWRPA